MSGTTTNTPNTVAIFNSNGELDADTNVSNSELQYLDGASGTTSINLLDNVASTTIISYESSNNGAFFDYVINRGSGNRRAGCVTIATDGTFIAHNDDGLATLGTVGVTFNAVISGSNVIIQYTSTATGTAPSLKYQLRRL